MHAPGVGFPIGDCLAASADFHSIGRRWRVRCLLLRFRFLLVLGTLSGFELRFPQSFLRFRA